MQTMSIDMLLMNTMSWELLLAKTICYTGSSVSLALGAQHFLPHSTPDNRLSVAAHDNSY